MNDSALAQENANFQQTQINYLVQRVAQLASENAELKAQLPIPDEEAEEDAG